MADAWAIHYGAGLRVATFDQGKAPLLAANLRGTLHPLVYEERNTMLDARSDRRLDGVRAPIAAVIRRAHEIRARHDDGVSFIVTEGIRTRERQASLVKAGVSWTMEGKHLTGHAVDVAATLHGTVQWDWPYYYTIAASVREAAIELGTPIRWGGVWDRMLNDLAGDLEDDVADYVSRRRAAGGKARIDGPHFEIDPEVRSA
jgi:peptidoglycan L-alanyl-D-glutamate endopeptidase CwlK